MPKTRDIKKQLAEQEQKDSGFVNSDDNTRETPAEWEKMYTKELESSKNLDELEEVYSKVKRSYGVVKLPPRGMGGAVTRMYMEDVEGAKHNLVYLFESLSNKFMEEHLEQVSLLVSNTRELTVKKFAEAEKALQQVKGIFEDVIQKQKECKYATARAQGIKHLFPDAPVPPEITEFFTPYGPLGKHTFGFSDKELEQEFLNRVLGKVLSE